MFRKKIFVKGNFMSFHIKKNVEFCAVFQKKKIEVNVQIENFIEKFNFFCVKKKFMIGLENIFEIKKYFQDN